MSYLKKYQDQRSAATKRVDKNGDPIQFKLTFDEWLDIWIESGHIQDRGIRPGQYVMSRYNDIGHYEVGNVFIQLSVNNLTDANIGRKHTPEHINKVAEQHRGKTLSDAHKQALVEGARRAHTGKTLTDEQIAHRQAVKIARGTVKGGRPIGHEVTDETKARIKATMTGRRHSEERRLNQSIAAKNRKLKDWVDMTPKTQEKLYYTGDSRVPEGWKP